MQSINHKTVFVLDHTPYFGISGENPIDLAFIRNPPRTQYPIHIPPITKSLWTCCVEASVEYCRIVWDLFPTGKLVFDSFIHFKYTFKCNCEIFYRYDLSFRTQLLILSTHGICPHKI